MVLKTQLSNNHRGNFEKHTTVCYKVRGVLGLHCEVNIGLLFICEPINFYSGMPSDPAANVVFWKGIVDISHIS